MSYSASQLSVVILGNSFAGAENQCWGLMEQLQRKAEFCHETRFNVEIRRILPTKNWIHVPPSLHILASGLLKQWTWVGLTEMDNTKNTNFKVYQKPPQAPYPDVVIASGRTTVPACVAFKRASQGRTYTVQIQHPRCDLRCFDAVVVPQHDLRWRAVGSVLHPQKVSRDIAGTNKLFENGMSNIVATFGSVHRVNSASIRQAWVEDKLTLMPFISWAGGKAKVVTILIGGSTPQCRWDTQNLIVALDKVVSLFQQDSSQLGSVDNQRISFLISLSRRSPANLLKDLYAWINRSQAASCSPIFKIWDPSIQTSSNPYLAMLHAADLIAVTADSVGMCSEACSTSKTVVTLLTDKCRGKLASFHAGLELGGFAMRVEDPALPGAIRAIPAPLHDAAAQVHSAGRGALKDTERVAELVLPRILAHCRRWRGQGAAGARAAAEGAAGEVNGGEGAAGA